MDVEYIRPVSNVEAIAERYFSQTEQQAMLNSSSEERINLFFQYWTRKEACLKAAGKGLSGLTEIRIIPDDPGNRDLHTVRFFEYLQKHWSVQPLHLLPGYAAAVSAEGSQAIIPVLQKIDGATFKTGL